MPFTIAHAAAALPIRWLSAAQLPLAALVIGSMAPDFEYPWRLAAVGRLGHSVSGIFTFCLPVGMLVLLFFQLRLWPWVMFLARRRHRERLASVPVRSVDSLATVFVSAFAIIIGAASHLVWDSFTHRNGWFVKQIPALEQRLASVAGLDIHVYQLVQHGSTAAGLAVLALAYAHWYRRTTPVTVAAYTSADARTWQVVLTALLVVPVISGIVLSAWSIHGLTGGRAVAGAVVQFAVGWIVGLALGLAALGLFVPPRCQLHPPPS